MERIEKMNYGGSFVTNQHRILTRTLGTYDVDEEGKETCVSLKQLPSVYQLEDKLLFLTEENDMLRWKVIPYDDDVYRTAKAHQLLELEYVKAQSCFEQGDFRVVKKHYHRINGTNMQQKPMIADIAYLVEQRDGNTWRKVPSVKQYSIPEHQAGPDGLPREVIAYFGPDGTQYIIPSKGNEHFFAHAESKKLTK